MMEISSKTSPWNTSVPIREELFGIDRMVQHAESLAAAQKITSTPQCVFPLRNRLNENAKNLLATYHSIATDLEGGEGIAHAAEWLLDNYHIVESQIREIRIALPPNYYQQLPKLADGPFAGYPRVLGVAWAFIAHTDSHFDPLTLRQFINAYQRVQLLTIGELWAVAITLRIVLVENLRRLADQIIQERTDRLNAERLAARVLGPGNTKLTLEREISTHPSKTLSDTFIVHLAKYLRNQDQRIMPAMAWLEGMSRERGASLDELIQRVQQHEGATNLSVRNVITSMRLISDIDWADLFESMSLVDEALNHGNDFYAMDFSTRNSYRSAIEQLAHRSKYSEVEIAEITLQLCSQARLSGDYDNTRRTREPGYFLIAEGRLQLEEAVEFKPTARLTISRLNLRMGIAGYIACNLLVTFFILVLSLSYLHLLDLPHHISLCLAILGFIPASEAGASMVNRLVIWSEVATRLPGLELRSGIPSSLRTLVAVPILLNNESDLLKHIERLEVHYLSGTEGEIYFALLSDFPDADQEVLPSDASLLALARDAILKLNQKYQVDNQHSQFSTRFLFLHRRRIFNASEGKWIGWERKRGKLRELNCLLRGELNTTFTTTEGDCPSVPEGIRYVITLDADTRVPRDVVGKLIGKMAHPLNQAIFDKSEQRVVKGYAILQPRVTPLLPLDHEGSRYQRIFSAPGGMDPYAMASSDIYQDLFGEGSYTGKGIYDVDAFESALDGRVPENSMLSHDLFEGIFARAGLVSDIEVVEEFPTRYDVSLKRQHRWTRGDWQLLPWLFNFSKEKSLPLIGRWKLLDNLRRSLVMPGFLVLFALCWWLPIMEGAKAIAVVLSLFALPALLPILTSLVPSRREINLIKHYRNLINEIKQAVSYLFLSFAFLVDQSIKMIDAILRTIIRLFITRKNLLEWTTAAQSKGNPYLTLHGFYQEMMGSTIFAVLIGIGAILSKPDSWPLILPFVLTWISAPYLAFSTSSVSATNNATPKVPTSTHTALRLTARRTWRFFERFVTPLDNMLPPDNFQEEPSPVIAHRTSPTNIGLYLLSTITARDFGWAGTIETLERLEATFAVLRELPKHRGHFFNWYGTLDLEVLDPPYVSSVDSGNLAGHLIALANACDEWLDTIQAPNAKSGMLDHLALTQEAVLTTPLVNHDDGRLLLLKLEEIGLQLNDPQLMFSLPSVKRLVDKTSSLIKGMINVANHEDPPDVIFWMDALYKSVTAHYRDQLTLQQAPESILTRLRVVSAAAREMANAMDFTFLIEPERKLLSIGYGLRENALDESCYDLLASEARLASFFAIAKGDVSTKHWFRLGRTATPLGKGSALISWSGSMFEYLMPSLVMRAPVGSLLEQTNQLIVGKQQAYGKSLGIPWGVSESAYNARDIEFTYQYSNFGVPGLGLKRGLSENIVIAPYATGLATMVDAQGAHTNFDLLTTKGALGRYGFYEAIDYTPSRLRDDQSLAIVRSYMAHHHGMTIVAIANTLMDGVMRNRFHCEPMIQGCELLLQERIPRDIAITHPRAEEVKAAAEVNDVIPFVRKLTGTPTHVPVTHLLSNGAYSIMVTTTGAGYSRWNDIAVTRWAADTTRENDGYFIFIKDMGSGDIWTSAGQVIQRAIVSSREKASDIVFSEDQAEFVKYDNNLVTQMNIVVSGEDNAEVRRVSLTNNGRRPFELELTSYLELVLTNPAADRAHPAFSKMFVVTEYLEEFGALVATRRLRSENDPAIWCAHFAVVEGNSIAPQQYESNRTHFIGRENTLKSSSVLINGGNLSNTVGTVLDPIFALRNRVRLEPGEVSRLAYWTVVASSREELLSIIDKHHDRNAFDRARTLAWTQAQVQMRYLDVTPEKVGDFQRLTAPILYSDPVFRSNSDAITRGTGSQSGLWPLAISGDLPIVLLRIDDIEDIPVVHELLRAHQYWRMKHLFVDLVIINERASSYVQDLQNAIETAVRTSQARRRGDEDLAKGIVFTLRADLMSLESRSLLLAVARVVFAARHGLIAEQLSRLPSPIIPSMTSPVKTTSEPSLRLPIVEELEFFNGLGGFALDGKEYVTVLDKGQTTPAPWINVISNGLFGFQVSAAGSGYTWAENSRENQLTAWSNDAVMDPCGEVFYVRDDLTGVICSPTAQPFRDDGRYVSRHGYGYSQFEHISNQLRMTLLQYVPLEDPIKISRLSIHNISNRPRKLVVTAYTEWVLGTSRSISAPFIVSEIDEITGALFVKNPWNLSYGRRVTFADLGGTQMGWTADRAEFIGRNRDLSNPRGLSVRQPLSGKVGAGLDPCAALQRTIFLAPGESIEVLSTIGQGTNVEAARELISKYRAMDLEAELVRVKSFWHGLLGGIQVKTPDRAMDIMLNGWLLYQTMSCRVLARSAFYQASGAYGFRDQLQDCMALTWIVPEISRAHLLRAAGRQFVEGDMQHWWQPQTGQGVRTHISDDCVWLAFATAHYVGCAGDTAVLEENIPFLEGQALHEGEHDSFFQPMISEESASLYEHCVRGLEHCIKLTGQHGLPLMGTGDWNDGMNRVGQAGKGESVWLGWLLIRTIDIFVPLALARKTSIDDERASNWSNHAQSVKAAIEREAWDGSWYRRATFDDGTWLGSKEGNECNIDSIAQSWAVLSGAGDPARVTQAMESLEEYLIRKDEKLALLFTPPFDQTDRDPGYIKGYPAGLRENGGQYSHAAMWTVLAYVKLGEGTKAAALFAMLNPINHSLDLSAAESYKVEPYVIAADVYSVPPLAGRGGWTWYTGSAGWMYRAGVEGILGIQRAGNDLVLKPCIPAHWGGFEVEINLLDTKYSIRLENDAGRNIPNEDSILNDIGEFLSNGEVRLPLNGGVHQLLLRY